MPDILLIATATPDRCAAFEAWRCSASFDRAAQMPRDVSRFPRKERPHMPVSATTPDRPGARDIAPIRVAFRQRNNVGAREEGSFAARWLACVIPCQCFADALPGSRA